MNPNNTKTIDALIAEFKACEYEKELFIKSHTKNTKPPKSPIKRLVNNAYPKLTLIETPSTYILFKLS